MKNRTALLVVVLIAGSAGCSSGTTPAPDPFFGRATIAPPSTQSGLTQTAAASSYPSAIVAAPVNPTVSRPGQTWSSPPQPNFGQKAPVSPPYGSVASTSQPTRPIYLSQAAIEDSVRQPSYIPSRNALSRSAPSRNVPNNGGRSLSGSTFTGSSRTVAAAGSNRATSSTRTTSPLKIYPAPGLQAINGQPVREQNSTTYRSADGSIPQYGDPRSSFGRTPRARFQNTSSASVAPTWSSSSAVSETSSSAVPETSLPPIRGYASLRQTTSNQTTRAQATASQMDQDRTALTSGRVAMPYRPSRGRQLASNLSPAFRRPRSLPTFAPAKPGEPRIMPIPPEAIDIADLPDVSRIASRPSTSGSAGGTRRLNYETPATDRSPRSTPSPSIHHDVQVRPVSFTPTILHSHEEDYRRLRGELEYSEIDQRWKLRYISIGEEKSDDYGGSVILSETAKLSGFERGDFIEVHGRILSGPQGDWGYARSYEVQEIRRIR